ncbi:MAG: electron transfer flavoprotein subunit alpha/FixB family protein, partial [Promicromonosporaceae bacterium]|nr:electron transfer flavoprotein subunit alpha/FixB family protein [Promicromonosporaceae bacterium]
MSNAQGVAASQGELTQSAADSGSHPETGSVAATRQTRTVLVLLDSPARGANPDGVDEVTEVRPTVLELITAGRELGRVDVVTLGAPTTGVLATLGAYGVSGVHQAALPTDIPAEARRLTPVMAAVLETAVRSVHADLLLVPWTFSAKEAAAVAAAHLGCGFVANAVTIAAPESAEVDHTTLPANTRFIATTVAFASTWHVEMALITDPVLVAMQPGGVAVTPAAVATVPEVYPLPVEVGAPGVEVLNREFQPSGSGRPDLEDATEVVAGGRGCGTDLSGVFALADALGAAVGVTRDLTFEGLFDRYIGTTGVTVAPRLYVAAGISGSPYHTGGMRASKYVVSINNDDDAPMNELADLVIVGDVATVLPETAALLTANK